MSDTLQLAPEALAGVQSAQEAMQKQVERLRATGDPSVPFMAALADTIQSSNRLVVDASLKQRAQAEAVGRALGEARKPWTRDEMRMLVTQLDRTLLHRWTQFNHAAVAVSVAATVLFGAACWGGGYWYRGAVPVVAGVRAGSERCQDGQDGSRLCWIPVWQRLPPPR